MKDFFQKMGYRMAEFMQGRYGMDGLSNFCTGIAVVLLILSIIPNLGFMTWPALVFIVLATWRMLSKNIAKRSAENAKYEQLMEKPKKQFSQFNKKWDNRKTTKYFTCKNCGQQLSVPKGKGTLRVVCPKCKTETKMKS